jgi:glycerophosphoryl diester phosphodiesterase
MVIAHRGDSAHAPENTLDAARLGWEMGADAWELDVHLTRDGVPVVIHDESLLRTTNVAERFAGDPRAGEGYLVSSLDFDEIRALDAGSWFVADRPEPRTALAFGTRDGLRADEIACYSSGEVRVPSLGECLDLTARLGWLVNVELKSFPDPNPRLLGAVVAEIEAAGVADRVLISSFDHRDVALAAGLDLPLSTGILTETPLYRPARYVREIVGADCYHASALALGAAADRYRKRPAPRELRTEDLKSLRGATVPILVYTVNDRSPDGLAMHLTGAGVSGLFTDDPNGLIKLFKSSPY